MATRSPTTHHSSWGSVSNLTALPSGPTVQKGDTVFVESVANVYFYDGGSWIPTGTVNSIGVTAPISSTGGTDPVISINAATSLADGSMSAADKLKLDGIASGASISGTIAANEVAFGTGSDAIGGSSQLQWNPGTNTFAIYDSGNLPALSVDAASKTTTITGDAASALVVASQIDGPFLEVSPTLYQATFTDPITPTNSLVLGPSDVAVGDGSASGNVNAGEVSASFVTGPLQYIKAGLQVPAGVPTIVATDEAAVAQPLNLSIGELQLNSAAGSPGDVLTSNGAGLAPTWTAPAASGITDLTGDVTATGPGSTAATVARIQGYEVATAAPINGNVLAWSSAQNKWVPGAPAVGGGAGGITFYLNGSTAAATPTTNIPVPSNTTSTLVQALETTVQTPLATIESNNLTQVPGAYDLVANFVTPPNAPGVTTIPAGLWSFNIWASSTGTSANQTIMQARVYKYDGAAAPTLIATSDDVSIYDPTVTAQYILTVVIPAGVTLMATDRVYIELRARALQNNRRITFSFGDGNPTHVQTTLPAAASGDLSGTYPNPTVAKIQGNPVSTSAPSVSDVLTWDGTEWAPAAGGGGGGGAVFAGSLTVYVDPVNGSDITGTGTLGAPYATINYAYSQVPSLGNPTNTVYNAQVGQFVTEKLIFQLAPGRYNENVLLGFKRGRVQLVGNGVQILGSVTMRAVRADFPASSMEAIKSSFPSPYTGAGTLATFEITGSCGGGVESDATADPFVVTGLTTLLFDEPTFAGAGLAPNWDSNYGQFNFYANKAYLIGGMVIATSYTVPTTNGLPVSVMEIDSCTIGESGIPYRSYLGGVPLAYATNPTTWNKGTGVAAGSGQTTTTLVDTSKAWTPNEYVGATVVITAGTNAGQTRTITSNTATSFTVSSAFPAAPVAGSTVYSLVGTTNKAPTGTITLKCHNSTIGASIGPRLTIGELDGCRIYDIDRTMLGTVDNGGVIGSTSTSYLGLVVNQFRQFSGTGYPPSQYQLGSALSGSRHKIDSTSYTTLAFNRNSSGVLSARTLNLPTSSGTATAGAGTTLTDTTKAWNASQWIGGTLTLTGGAGSGQSRTITANTATQITVSPAFSPAPAAGTTYTVTALVAFDLQDDARSLAYTPTTGAHWLDPDPTTVGSALDKVGGLGLLAAAPTNGQIPIGNGTSYTPATLTAGMGVAITNASGAITIATTINSQLAVSNGTSTAVDAGAFYIPSTTTFTTIEAAIMSAAAASGNGQVSIINASTGVAIYTWADAGPSTGWRISTLATAGSGGVVGPYVFNTGWYRVTFANATGNGNVQVLMNLRMV